MTYTLIATIVYIATAIAMTLYVGRVLRENGRPFLEDAFKGRPDLAEAINILLNTGFYLLNLGIIGASLKFPLDAHNTVEAINVAGYRLGFEILTIGVIHFFNMHMIHKARRGERRHRHPDPLPEPTA